MTSRCIRLRRPATLSMVDEPFVPQTGSLDAIDRRWEDLCAGNPAFFDGRLLHVIGVHRNGCGGAVLHVADCAYRFHAVQDESFDLGVRPLGVKGFTVRRGRVLLGRRSQSVAHYRGLWEFAPGGVVEPGCEPIEVVVRELQEETGLEPSRDPTPVALVFDEILRTWEMVFRIEIAPDAEPAPTAEYPEIRWCRPDDLPERLSPVARSMGELLGELG